MRKCSVEENDLNGRMSKILAQLWGVHYSDPAKKEQAPSLTIKSRFCASILHDSLWLWRERFGGQGGSATPPSQPGPGPPSPRQTTPPPPRLDRSADTNLVSSSSPPVPPSDFISPNLSPQLRQDHLVPAGHLGYGPNALSTDYLPFDLDMGQEAQDWMWHVGFPLVIAGNPDFYPPHVGTRF
jgi:hypothetical protein